MNAKRSNLGFVSLLLLLGLLAGCSRQSEERLVDLTVPVTVQPVELDTIESVVRTTGTLRPIKEAELITEVKGHLFFAEVDGKRKLTEGSVISEGQEVAQLENQELVVNARLESWKLARETARRALKEHEVLLKRGLVTETDVETARKNLADAESNYQDALIQIEKTRIRTPISGVLTELTDATERTFINQGTLIGKVVDYSQVLVDLRIPNSQIRAVGLGQVIRVRNYAFPDQMFTGRITGVDPALDPTTRTFRVIGTIGNPDPLLRPGMFVEVEIVTEAHEDVVLIPRELVLIRQNRKVVFVEEEGRAQMRQVETGLEDRKRVEILDGLEEGERLITSNYETLRSRTRVRVAGQGASGGRR